MPLWPTILVGVYCGIAAFVMLLARVIVNPYGHLTSAQAWRQAVGLGVLWLPELVWLIAAVTWDWWQTRFRD